MWITPSLVAHFSTPNAGRWHCWPMEGAETEPEHNKNCFLVPTCVLCLYSEDRKDREQPELYEQTAVMVLPPALPFL